MDFERKFKGIWIPASLYLTFDLTPVEKILLVEIDSLDNGDSGCYASNAYFSKFLQISSDHVSRLINGLVSKGLIKSQLKTQKGQNNSRIININYPINQPFPVENLPSIRADFVGSRKFSGVWIPAALYLTDGISPIQKILLTEIDSLDLSDRGCFAGNSYFAKFLQLSESQASRHINELVKKGLVGSKMVLVQGRTSSRNMRSLYIPNPIDQAFPSEVLEQICSFGGIRKNAEGVSAKMQRGYPQECGGGIGKNAEHNKTSNKTNHKQDKSLVAFATVERDLEADFELLWQAYPNHKSGKKKPKAKLEKLMRDGVSLHTLIKAIEVHKTTRNWIMGFVPYLTTWLNGALREAEFSPSDFILSERDKRQLQGNTPASRLSDNSALDQLAQGNYQNRAMRTVNPSNQQNQSWDRGQSSWPQNYIEHGKH